MEIKRINKVVDFINPTVDLVCFDIDNTILDSKNLPNLPLWAQAIEKHVRSHPKGQELEGENFFEYIQTHINNYLNKMDPIVIEPEIFDLIAKVRAHNIPIIGLTNRPLLSSDTTVKQLQLFNLNFADHPFEPKTCNFNLMRQAIFKDGIITGNSNNKGLLLKSFLDVVHCQPRKVVFVDDCHLFVNEVEQSLKEAQIECLAFRYGYLDEKLRDFIFTLDMIPEDLR